MICKIIYEYQDYVLTVTVSCAIARNNCKTLSLQSHKSLLSVQVIICLYSHTKPF